MIIKILCDTEYLREGVISVIYIAPIFYAFLCGRYIGLTKNNKYINIIILSYILQSIICIFTKISKAFGLAISLLYVGSTRFIENIFENSSWQAYGTLGNPNYSGFFLVSGLILILEIRKMPKSLKGILWLFGLFGVVATGSRTAFFLFFCYPFARSVFLYFKNKITIDRIVFIYLTLIICMILLVFMVVYRYEVMGLLNILTGRKYYDSIESMVDMSSFGLRYRTWENFDYNIDNLFEFFGGSLNTANRVAVDNQFLYLVSRYGIIGTIFIFAFFSYSYIYEGKRTNERGFSFLLIILLFFLGFIAEYWVNPYFGPIYSFFYGLIFGIKYGDKRRIVFTRSQSKTK